MELDLSKLLHENVVLLFFLVPAQVYVGQFLATFEEFPPRQKAASFSIDQVMEKLQTTTGSPKPDPGRPELAASGRRYWVLG